MYSSTLFGALLSSLALVSVNGSCSRDVEAIYNDETLQNATQQMITVFGTKCGEDKSCTASNYEETLVATNKLIKDAGGPEDSLNIFGSGVNSDEVNALAEEVTKTLDNEQLALLIKESSPPISLMATVNFSTFTSDSSYKEYVAACTKLGATITPVNIDIVIKGAEAFATILETVTDNGFDMDIDVLMKSFPVCLSSSCDDEEDLSEVVDQVLGSQLLSANLDDLGTTLPEGLDADALGQILKVATITNFCLFGLGDGLEKCTFTVQRTGENQSSKNNGGTSDGYSNNIVTKFAIAAVVATTSLVLA